MKKLFALLMLSACSAPVVERVSVSLALDFNADTLLEVYATSGASCGTIGAGPPEDVAEVHGVDAVAANQLNEGGQVSLAFDALPAGVELAFVARATEGEALLAIACTDGVVLEVGSDVSVELELLSSEN